MEKTMLRYLFQILFFLCLSSVKSIPLLAQSLPICFLQAYISEENRDNYPILKYRVILENDGNILNINDFNNSQKLYEKLEYYLNKDKCLLPADHDIYDTSSTRKFPTTYEYNSDWQINKHENLYDQLQYDLYYTLPIKKKLRILRGIFQNDEHHNYSDRLMNKIIIDNIILSSFGRDITSLENFLQINHTFKNRYVNSYRLLLSAAKFNLGYYYEKKIHYTDNSSGLLKKAESQIYSKKCFYIGRNHENKLVSISPIQSYLFLWDFEFCVFQDNLSTSRDLLYYFPGFSSKPDSWGDLKSLREIRHYWRKNKIDIPTTISISYGKSSSFIEPGLFEKFKNEAVEYVESLLEFTPNKRYGIGISLGGGNLAYFILKEPTFFEKVYIEAPNLFSINPFDSENKIDTYLESNGALKWIFHWFIIPIAKFKSGTPYQFFRNNVMSIILNNGFPKKSPEILIAVSRNDELGIQKNAEKFNEIAHKYGVNCRLEIIDCITKDLVFPYNYILRKDGHTIEHVKLIANFFETSWL